MLRYPACDKANLCSFSLILLCPFVTQRDSSFNSCCPRAGHTKVLAPQTSPGLDAQLVCRLEEILGRISDEVGRPGFSCVACLHPQEAANSSLLRSRKQLPPVRRSARQEILSYRGDWMLEFPDRDERLCKLCFVHSLRDGAFF